MSDDLIRRLRACANGIGSFKSHKGDYGICDDAADRIEAQEALLKEAMEALRFYADEHCNGYLVWITDYGLATKSGPIITDGGDRARATLAKLRAHLEDKT